MQVTCIALFDLDLTVAMLTFLQLIAKIASTKYIKYMLEFSKLLISTFLRRVNYVFTSEIIFYFAINLCACMACFDVFDTYHIGYEN